MAYAGYIVALIGGIILVIFGLFGIFSSPFVGIFSASILNGLSAFVGGIVTLILGILAMAGSRFASTILWGVVLLIVGVIAGGVGGTLVLIGALLGLDFKSHLSFMYLFKLAPIHLHHFKAGRSVLGSFVVTVFACEPWKTNCQSAAFANRIHGTHVNRT